MDPSSASKSEVIEERRKPKMMPMRIHEMDLGLPKSPAQPRKTQRSQPIRVGPLLEAMERNSSKTNSSARRITVAPGGIGNVRRQLYNETADQTLPDTHKLGGSHSSTENSAKKLINVGSAGKSQPVRLGLSKSDGKVKMNDQRQPVRVKLLMESWEKSQTAKRAGQKSVMGRLRSVNVRRKLYSVVPSPGASQKVAKKSSASCKPQETANTSQKVEKVVKANAGASRNAAASENASRKSLLMPPNSIRDKHISLKAKDTIIEESPTSLLSEEQNITNPPKITGEIKVGTAPDVHHQIATLPEAESLPRVLQSVESVVAGSSQQSEKVFESNIEIPRPSVIMGLATSTVSKSRNQSVSSDSSSKSGFALSHPPLQELNKNSTMPVHRLDAADTSLQDLLGNSQHDRHVSPRSSILPYNSFLRNCESSEQSLAQMDQQTLSWLHGNLKLCIQTTEESLFSMKTMLKTIEDIMNSSKPEKKPLNVDINDDVPAGVPKIFVGDTEVNGEELERNDSLHISYAHEDEIFEGEPQENYDEDFAEEDKENLLTINYQGEEKEQEEKGEKTRRRSIRLAAIEARSIKNPDDSFSRIEKELNITHDKSKHGTPNKSTPAKRKNVDPRSRRSIREYMALKSCAKFLQTPDHKGLPTPKCEKNGTPAQRRAAERALSLRVLNQLHNLYDDSPE